MNRQQRVPKEFLWKSEQLECRVRLLEQALAHNGEGAFAATPTAIQQKTG